MQHQMNGRQGADGTQSWDINPWLANSIYTVRRAYGDSQRIHTGLTDKAERFLRFGIQLFIVIRLDKVGRPNATQFSLHRNAAGMSILYHLPRNAYIFVQWFFGGVNHHRDETGSNGILNNRKFFGMVEMQHDRHSDVFSFELSEKFLCEARRGDLVAGQFFLRDLNDKR